MSLLAERKLEKPNLGRKWKKVLVEGIDRIKITEFKNEKDYLLSSTEVVKDKVSLKADMLSELILETRRILLIRVGLGQGVRRSQGLECHPNVSVGEISGHFVNLPSDYSNLGQVPMTTSADMRTGVYYTTHANKRAFPFFALDHNPIKNDKFKPEEYWKIKADVEIEDNIHINANLISVDDQKVEKFTFKNEDSTKKIVEDIKTKKFKISDISKKPATRNPDAPFSTSTLQQTASSIFGFGASRTMQIAQKLFQGIDIEGETVGLITYMRTDSTEISKEAIESYRSYLKTNFDNNYLPKEVRTYKSKKAKNVVGQVNISRNG